MMNVEFYFNDTIARYNLFKQAAFRLLQDVPSLVPEDIRVRCEELTAMYLELQENKEQFLVIIEFFGPGILETTYIGDFQRALDKSITVCEALYQEILAYRENLKAVDRKESPAVELTNFIHPGTIIQ